MKILTAGTLAKVGTRMGVEPLVVVKVDWVTGAIYYADRDIPAISALGKIINFSPIQGTLNERSFGQVQSASVTLIDDDGSLKDLFDHTVVEQRPVTVYHYYEGCADLTTILTGKVVSPIEWSEGERTLKFEINAEIDSDDLLLEIKEVSTDFPSEDDIGKCLPLCFGSPIRVPAMELSLGPVGKLTSPITSNTTWYIRNGSKVIFNSTSFHVTNFEAYHMAGYIILEIDDTLFLGSFNDPDDATNFTCAGLGSFNTGIPISVSIDNRNEDDAMYADANCFYHSGTTDLKGKYVLIRWNQTNYFDSYIDSNGNTMKSYTVEESYSKYKDAPTGSPRTVSQELKQESFVAQISNHEIQNRRVFLSKPVISKSGKPILLGRDVIAQVKSIKGKPDFEWNQLPSSSTPHEWVIPTGTRVRIYNTGSIFVINSTTTTTVHEVVAHRNGIFQTVPSSYYTKNLAHTMNINGEKVVVSTINMTRALSQRTGEEWDGDQIYVTLTSSIGSNLVDDIIPWIITNRTRGLTVDNVTRASVSVLIENYPCHFAALSQMDSVAAIRSYSWQARIGVYMDAGITYFKYLSAEPVTSVYTATLDKIKFKSMKISKTETDNIHPKITSRWQKTYVDEDWERKKIIKENNKLIYKKNDLEMNYTIYNIGSLVEKSASFWSNRLSNAWIHISIDTFLTSLAVQIWDNVTVSCPFINDGIDIIGIVDGIDFDTGTHGIVLQVWLPICQGEGSAYLDDSADTLPVNPTDGIVERNFAIPIAQPRSITTSSFRRNNAIGTSQDEEEYK